MLLGERAYSRARAGRTWRGHGIVSASESSLCHSIYIGICLQFSAIKHSLKYALTEINKHSSGLLDLVLKL